MARFLYTARVSPKDMIQGAVEAEDLPSAVSKVAQMGLTPIDIQPDQAGTSFAATGRFFQRSIPGRLLADTTRQLSDLLESGLTMLNALAVVGQQTANERLWRVLQDVAEVIKGGSTLAEGLNRHPEVFSPMYVALVRAGETAGALEEVLRRLADAAEAEEELKSKIWTALTYPLFLSVVGLLTILVLLGFVIPRLATMFADMGQMLPLPTRIILMVSHGIAQYGLLLAILLILGWFALKRFVRSHEGKLFVDRWLLRIPVIGRLITQAEITRFGRTLGTLLTQGVAVLQAMGIVRDTVENELIREDLKAVEEEIKKGSSVAQAIAKSKTIPPFVQSMISVGEAGGKLEQALSKVASTYEREVDRTVKVFTTLLEPVLILVMGLIVGGIVISMLLPIFQLNLMVR